MLFVSREHAGSRRYIRRVLWKIYVTPDGYSGNAIWQPPAIGLQRGVLYVGTGNNYEVPASVKTCLANSSVAQQPSCFAPDDYFDTALALDLGTGGEHWCFRSGGSVLGGLLLRGRLIEEILGGLRSIVGIAVELIAAPKCARIVPAFQL